MYDDFCRVATVILKTNYRTFPENKLNFSIFHNFGIYSELVILSTMVADKYFEFTHLNWLKKSSTMVVENFGIHSFQLVKNIFKFSTIVREKFGIHSSELAKNVSKIGRHCWGKFWNSLVSIG